MSSRPSPAATLRQRGRLPARWIVTNGRHRTFAWPRNLRCVRMLRSARRSGPSPATSWPRRARSSNDQAQARRGRGSRLPQGDEALARAAAPAGTLSRRGRAAAARARRAISRANSPARAMRNRRSRRWTISSRTRRRCRRGRSRRSAPASTRCALNAEAAHADAGGARAADHRARCRRHRRERLAARPISFAELARELTETYKLARDDAPSADWRTRRAGGAARSAPPRGRASLPDGAGRAAVAEIRPAVGRGSAAAARPARRVPGPLGAAAASRRRISRSRRGARGSRR